MQQSRKAPGLPGASTLFGAHLPALVVTGFVDPGRSALDDAQGGSWGLGWREGPGQRFAQNLVNDAL